MGRFHVDPIAEAIEYAQGIVAGEIAACKWVKAACRRQIDDLERSRTDPEWPYVWAPEPAARVIGYLERLKHVKGKWGGTPLRLEPWQLFYVSCVFGWVRRDDGLRRFRTAYLEVPRKNAKTTLLAGLGLYMLTADGEIGPEVYSAATTRDQARVVFEIAQQMARSDGLFRARFGVEVLERSIIAREEGGKFLPLSADGHTLDGLNVSCGLIDELHAHRTRAVHDVLDSGTGSRAQPLMLKITTAGSNRAGVCWDQRSYTTKLLNAVLRRHGGLGYEVKGDSAEDETYFGLIYTIDDEDDPFDPAVWAKANPNWGVSVMPDDVARMATVARSQPAALAEFLTKRLNVWVSADTAWLNMLSWDACARAGLSDDEFLGEPCWIGLDAAFKHDLFAAVRVFRRGNGYAVRGRYYMPQARAERMGDQVLAWVRHGRIVTTPGEVLDIAAVREDLLADAERYDVRELAYDPAQITPFAAELFNTHGLPCVEIRPTVLNFSPAMKELEALVADARLAHDGDPVLAWMVSNVVCHRDAKDNIYPRKSSADAKIDGAIALIMALARAMAVAEVEAEPEIVIL